METEREKLLGKVRALMAKTVENGCTEEEHLAALAKAQAMIDAYVITDAELSLTKEEKAVFRREPKGTPDPHSIKRQLAVGVAKFASCKVWRDNREGAGALVFCGLRSDAQFATWLLDHLALYVQKALAEHLMGDLAYGGDRRLVINGFVIGCCSRISGRLNELVTGSQAAAVGNSRALVVVKDAAITAKMAEAGVNLRKSRSSSRQYDAGAYAAGRAAGDRASFGRPVSGNQGTLRIGSK